MEMTAKQEKDAVLILVLMEYTLRGRLNSDIENGNLGLNPCFNGIYSQSGK